VPEHEKTPLEEVLSLHDGTVSVQTEEPSSLITFEDTETPKMGIIREPSPPPVRAEVQDLAAITSEVSQTASLQDEIVRTESPLQVHIVCNIKKFIGNAGGFFPRNIISSFAFSFRVIVFSFAVNNIDGQLYEGC